MSEAASEAPGVKLRQLLIAVGDPLVDVLAAPGGFDVPVRDVVILDPDDQADTHTGELVLVIGARGRAAIRLVRAAARRGAVAVAVKVDGDEDVSTLRDTAIDGGIALLRLPNLKIFRYFRLETERHRSHLPMALGRASSL